MKRSVVGSTLYCLEKTNARQALKTNPSLPIGGGFQLMQPETRETRERLLRIKPSLCSVKARRTRIGPLKRFLPRLVLRGNPRM